MVKHQRDGMIEILYKTISNKSAGRFGVLALATLIAALLHFCGLVLGLGVELASFLRLPVGILAMIVVSLVAQQHSGLAQKGWRFIALAVFLWLVGDIIYGISEVLLGIDPEGAVWLSIPYFLATFAMIASVGFLGYYSHQPSERLAAWLETLIVVCGLGTFLWMLFLGNLFATKPLAEIWVDLVAPLVGLGLVGFMVSYLLGQRQALQTSTLLTLGTICIAVLIEGADYVRSVSVYYSGHGIDGFGSLAFVFFSLAAVSSLIPASSQTDERYWARFVGLLPYLAFALAFFSFVWFFLSSAHETAPEVIEFGMIIGIGVLAFLIGFRMVLANQVNVRLTNDLLESDQRLRLALSGSNDGIWDWKLRHNTIALSPRLNALLGYPEEASVSSLEEWRQRTHPEDLERVEEMVWCVVKGKQESFSVEIRYRCQNGDYCWFLLSGAAERSNNRTVRMAGSLSDLSTRFGLYDSLTGLANRVLFREYVERAILRQTRHGDAFWVLFLDLNDFKVINDTLGHLAGDELLAAVARRLEKTVRQGDILARLGGDEFAVLAEQRHITDNTTTSEGINIAMLAERLSRHLEQPFVVSGKPISISASVGIVSSRGAFSRVDEFLSAADTAMYHAKQNRTKVAFFDQAMSERLHRRLELEQGLRDALGNNELKLHFHAILEAKTLVVLGYETLLRWNHQQTPIAPDVFIPLAEQNGFILELGAWVMRQSCQTAMRWNNTKAVSVNVSSRQFEQDDFVDTVVQVLRETGLPAQRLVLEITESMLLERAQAHLLALRKLGVQVQIDDFGTGYSSLSYLHRFPVSALKIDKSFVAGIEQNQTRSVVGAIVALAQNLGIRVIAEGVETQAQLEWLQTLGCDAVQGYLFSRPVPAEALES